MIVVNLGAIESHEDDILKVGQVQRDPGGLAAAGQDLGREAVQGIQDQRNTGLQRTKSSQCTITLTNSNQS